MKEKEEEAGPHGKRAKSAEEALAGLMRYAARGGAFQRRCAAADASVERARSR